MEENIEFAEKNIIVCRDGVCRVGKFDGAKDEKEMNEKWNHWYSYSKELPRLKVKGFYKSFNYNVMNQDRLIMSVTGTGRVVSDCVLSYYKREKHRQTIILHESREKYSFYSSLNQYEFNGDSMVIEVSPLEVKQQKSQTPSYVGMNRRRGITTSCEEQVDTFFQKINSKEIFDTNRHIIINLRFDNGITSDQRRNAYDALLKVC